MCGIGGIAQFGSASPVARDRLERMTDTMVHRGPEAYGYFTHNGVGLGHRRLKIIDLAGGDQPIYNEDRRIVVVYNGEIYNFQEIRKELESKGHRFRTNSDTEVIVHAYEDEGPECVKRFRGMFAFAVYDALNDRLLLARDPMGIKPLYYTWNRGELLFASEVRAILTGLDNQPGVNVGALDSYLMLGYTPNEDTLFAGIHKLRPGHLLLCDRNGLQTRPYWDLTDGPIRNSPFSVIREEFESLLLDTVRMHLISDVPVGAFLSGGLDSSAVVSLVQRSGAGPVKTFSIGYVDDDVSNELPYARLVAKHLGTEHHEYTLHGKEFFETLPALVQHLEEPVVEAAGVALYHLARLAREHVVVILSGEGGDEILAGYPLYRISRWLNTLYPFARWTPTLLVSAVGAVVGATEKQRKYADWIRQPLRSRYRGISSDVTGSIRRAMYHPALLDQITSDWNADFESIYDAFPRSSSLRRMSCIDIKSWLPDDLLLKADKMTMAHSLELRVPLLDHRVVEFALSLPDRYRLNGSEGKYLLKRVMEPHLPREIIYRTKRGFPIPISVWFRGSLQRQVADLLNDGELVARKFIRREYVARALQQHREGREDLSRRLFSLVVLELWLRTFMQA